MGLCLPCSTLDYGDGNGRCTGCIFQLYFPSDRLKDFDVLSRYCGAHALKRKIEMYSEQGQHVAKLWIDLKLKRIDPVYFMKRKCEAELAFLSKMIEELLQRRLEKRLEAQLPSFRTKNEDLELTDVKAKVNALAAGDAAAAVLRTVAHPTSNSVAVQGSISISNKEKAEGSGKSVKGRKRSMKAMGEADYIKDIAAANVLARNIFADVERKDVCRPAKKSKE